MKVLTKQQLNKEAVSLEITPEKEQKILFSLLEDMAADKEVLAQQAKVNFSILEDINEAQGELKKRYSELDTLKELVQELGASLKVTSIFERLIGALKKTMHPSSNFAYVLAPVGPSQSTNTIYLYATCSIGDAYLKSIEEDIVRKIHNLTASILSKPADWIKNDFSFEVLGGLREEENNKLP